MNKMGRMLTDDELLEKLSYHCSEKEYNIFVDDFNKTKMALKETTEQMSEQMLNGIAQNEEEKKTIKAYNKLCRHHAKLRGRLERLSWCL